MALSHELISQFAKIVNSDKKQSTESTIYGTVVDQHGHKPGDVDSNGHEIVIDENGGKYFKPDGSDQLIPITENNEDPAKANTMSNVDYGNRASVLIKDHTATVTGNISSPAANNKDIETKITEFDIAVGDQLQANKGYFGELIADKANVGNLTAAIIGVTELIAKDSEIENLVADKATLTDVIATKIDTDVIIADNAIIEHLKASNIDVLSLIADKAVMEELIANNADLNSVEAKNAYLKYATIDFSNIGEAAITKLFADSGIIDHLVVNDGEIAGELIGVTIKGDLIQANTLKADKLVVKGEDGMYYKLNIDGLNNISTTQASKFTLLDTKPDNWETNFKDYYIISDDNYVHIPDNEIPNWQSNIYYKLNSNYESGLDGTVIVANSITAEKIAVDDLTAFGATIAGFKMEPQDEDMGTPAKIYSGAKSSVDADIIDGIYMDENGQMNLGNANSYLKFYKDSDGNYKLSISAESILFGVGKQFSLDDRGMTVAGDNDNNVRIETNISNNGMRVYANNDEKLKADDKGVVAKDLHARTYLIINGTSRFEKIRNSNRVGCFWIGE